MNDGTTLFTQQLSDEAAFELSEALNWLSFACDEHYYAQISRHLALNESIQMNLEKPWEKNKKSD